MLTYVHTSLLATSSMSKISLKGKDLHEVIPWISWLPLGRIQPQSLLWLPFGSSTSRLKTVAVVILDCMSWVYVVLNNAVFGFIDDDRRKPIALFSVSCICRSNCVPASRCLYERRFKLHSMCIVWDATVQKMSDVSSLLSRQLSYLRRDHDGYKTKLLLTR